MKKLRFLISLPTSKNDFQLAQALSAEQTAQKRAIDLEIVDQLSLGCDSQPCRLAVPVRIIGEV